MLAVVLAIRDLRHDFGAFLGLTIALAAILTPLLLLTALKNGITGAMLDELRNDHSVLQIQFLNDTTITPERYAEIQALPEVGFHAPMGRQISETILLETSDLRSEAATLMASGAGDPLLGMDAAPDVFEVILSSRVQEQLQVETGDTISIVISDRRSNKDFEHDLTVLGTSDVLSGRFVLGHPDLALAIQYIASGTAVSFLGFAGDPPINQTPEITRLRLYADEIRNVAPLATQLRKMGFVIRSEEGRITGILQLERNLSWILQAIVFLAGTGYVLALSVSLWVNVKRKRKSLAMLRLMGLSTRNMVLFPITQGACVAFTGAIVAVGVAGAVGGILNAQFDGALPAQARIARISGLELLALLFATFAASLFAAGLAGHAISTLQPKEALRDA